MKNCKEGISFGGSCFGGLGQGLLLKEHQIPCKRIQGCLCRQSSLWWQSQEYFPCFMQNKLPITQCFSNSYPFLFQVSGSDSQAAVHSSSIRRLVFFVELYFMWMWNDTMTKASRTGTQIPEWLAAPHFPQHKQTIHSVMPWYWNCRGAGGRRENICTREKQGLLNKQNIFLLFLRWVKVCVTPGSKWLRKTLNCVAVA